MLDTSTVSAATLAIPDESVLERLAVHEFECAIASVVWHELVFGYERLQESHRKAELSRFLFEVIRHLPILSYDERAAEWRGRERARQAALGRPAPYVDGQIAAVARTHELVLVTANVKDFDGRFEGLRVENWRSAPA
ncbi:MAG TPA: type II toxin-antitoxin system VapC family toxin [Tepidiformaceae bacterium]|nr:type II toxin-antitoxin system VapC family toxin [Tepidiformaceae bacterium]HMO95777.1 type II toxin-antitoxin system VapC family toxin [Tepidiformaceae bacterium]